MRLSSPTPPKGKAYRDGQRNLATPPTRCIFNVFARMAGFNHQNLFRLLARDPVATSLRHATQRLAEHNDKDDRLRGTWKPGLDNHQSSCLRRNIFFHCNATIDVIVCTVEHCSKPLLVGSCCFSNQIVLYEHILAKCFDYNYINR